MHLCGVSVGVLKDQMIVVGIVWWSVDEWMHVEVMKLDEGVQCTIRE